MKNIIFSLSLLIIAALSFTQCSNDELDKYFLNPSKVTSVRIDRMMPGIFRNTGDFWCPEYGRYYTLDATWLGTFTQTLGGKSAGAEMYQPSYDVTGYWNGFYNALGNYRVMEQRYDAMAEAEKASAECFMLATKIYLYDYLTLLLGIYGDVPLNKAGYLPITGDIPSSFATYESDEALTEQILDELEAINARFADAGFQETSAKTTFATQDIFLRGDLAKWRAYANNIRLRLANRIASNPSSLQAKGKAVLKTVIENPQANPVTETNDDNIIIRNYRNSFMDYNAGSGLHENSGWRSEAQQALIDRMRTDPRLRLLYTKTDTASYREANPDDRKYNPANGVYLGRDFKDLQGRDTKGETNFYREIGGTGVSRVVQYGFFWENKAFDAFLFSAPEIWFIKAEASARGDAGVPGETTESCFKKAVELSLQYYFQYYQNRVPNGGGNPPDEYKTVTVPDDAAVSLFASERWAAVGTEYVNEIDAIITQKWIHFSVLCTREQWMDIRRTGFPSGLYYPRGSGTIPKAPDRWRYPQSEVVYNPHNYATVKDKDNYDRPLFWMKTDWSDNAYSGKPY